METNDIGTLETNENIELNAACSVVPARVLRECLSSYYSHKLPRRDKTPERISKIFAVRIHLEKTLERFEQVSVSLVQACGGTNRITALY